MAGPPDQLYRRGAHRGAQDGACSAAGPHRGAGRTTWSNWAATAWPSGRYSPASRTATTRWTITASTRGWALNDWLPDHLVAQCRGTGRPAAARRGVQPRRPGLPGVPGRARARPVLAARCPGSGSTLTARGPTARRAPTASAMPTSRGAATWSSSTTLSRLVQGRRCPRHAALAGPGGASGSAARRRLRRATGRVWRTATDRVRAGHPDAWLVGAAIHGHDGPAVRKGGLVSVTQVRAVEGDLELAQRNRNFFELAHARRAWTMSSRPPSCSLDVRRQIIDVHPAGQPGARLPPPGARAWPILFTVAWASPSAYAGDEQGLPRRQVRPRGR